MNADAVKARLKNFAEKSGCTFQEALTYYGMERILYRISISPYAEHFVLTGASFYPPSSTGNMNGQPQTSICLPVQ